MAKQPPVKAWADLTKAEQEIIRRSLLQGRDELEKRAAAKTKSSFTLKGYVRCELAASDKEAFKAWEAAQDDAECLGQLVKVVDSGYLLKVGESGQGYQASISAATTGTDWDGYVLTAHASSCGRAIALLVYKHLVLMESDWSAWVAEGGEDFFR
jgi:hypothetical protein